MSVKCTMNRDVWKKTCLIGAFIQYLTHIWLDVLGLFLDREVQNYVPGLYFW